MNLRWVRISIDCNAAAADPAAAALFEAGCAGSEEHPDGVAGYLPMDDTLERRLDRLRVCLDRIPARIQETSPEIALTFVEESDWANAWKAHFHPIPIGRLVIAPSWCDYAPRPDQVVVELDPGMAFGTGAHPTTQLCLRALERFVAGGETVLDWGTGSGLLAIAAARLGAAHIVAGDVDSMAARIAMENARRNGVEEKVVLVVAESPACLRLRADLVVCNILAGVIIDLADDLAAALRPGGVLIASGIIDSRCDEVRSALERRSLRSVAVETDGEWVALIHSKERETPAMPTPRKANGS